MTGWGSLVFMQPVVAGMLLLTALITASWNAVLRGGRDRLWIVVVMCSMAALVALGMTFFLPAPAPASWPYIGASALLQIANCLLLVHAYETGELSLVYPVARGTTPLLVTVGAAVVARQVPSVLALAGIAFVSAGVLLIASTQSLRHLRTIASALAIGVVAASFTLVDGLGVRLSHQPRAYAAWLFLLQGAPMLPLYFIARRTLLPAVPIVETIRALVAGLLALGAYVLILSALALGGNIGPISAFSQTSILFAAAIGWLFLKEQVTQRRLLSTAMVSAGAIAIAVSG